MAYPAARAPVAERCAVLSGDDSDFVLNIITFYTGGRWSEIMGLGPKLISQVLVNIHWKLYELNGRFYRGRPKDGSIRYADIPAFPATLLEWQIDTHPNRKCICRNEDAPWCPGMEYVFLTSDNAHHRALTTHRALCGPPRTGGTQGGPGDMVARLCRCSSTPMQRVMMDDLNIRYVLQAERMGHEVPGMRGIYTHIAPEWRVDLVNGLQRLWEESLDRRALYSPRSAVPLLDSLLAAYRQPPVKEP